MPRAFSLYQLGLLARRRLIEALRDLCATVRTLPKPVVCAIHGHCLGGALELAASCDFRVCTPDARLGMPEVSLGIPSVIDAVMLAHHIGAGRARELLLTGDPIDGETAYAWGLANRLAPPEALARTAADLLRQVTRHAPEVIAAQKTLHQQWLDLPYSEAVERSIEPLLDAVRAGRPQQAARALLENTELPPQDIVKRSLTIAGDICIYTNQNHLIEVLD